MSKYNLPPEQLAKIEHTYTTGAGEYTQVQSKHGLTQQEWNDLPEYQQRQYYYEYGKPAGSPKDPENQLPRAHTPDGKWGVEAEKGYEVDPQELRTLASNMSSKFTAWESRLKKVSKISITKANLGNVEGSQHFEELAGQSRDGFGAYLNDITLAYKSVIEKLKLTADNYENAHGQTQKTVNSVNPGGNANFK
ncbi:hypothetical protein [Actinomadura rubrisoli]|uniref:Uncharacterized protein n=1 Tax=Actinomadura rubrisoli TaxID=2530368 RepID=A0A4R5BEL9_9ACTN|nr:hypothetical protein [Actinomadura rubrisoli]TDD83280.1 hypothetical protein E1298_21430 [Actinomadura rubrisoli]